MNLLIEIMQKIEAERWCLQYGGICSTCGMRDARQELDKYAIEDMIEAIGSMDFNDHDLYRSPGFLCTRLRMIYSYITIDNIPEFAILEDKLRRDFPDNDFITDLISSNIHTHWENQKLEEKNQKIRKIQRQEERELLKKCNQKDHNLRRSQYRKDLIKKLEELNIEKRMEYIAHDTHHCIKFYPSILIIEAKESFNEFDKDILKKLLQKLQSSSHRRGPWSRFKLQLLSYMEEEERKYKKRHRKRYRMGKYFASRN